MKEYEGKIEFNLTANVAVEGKDREDAKRKLKRLQDRLVNFLKREVDVDVVLGNRFESYVYTDENWKPTPRRDDERYLVYEREGDREYFEEYYDGDQSRIEDAVWDSEEAEREILKEIEVGEVYFKERCHYQTEEDVSWRNVRSDGYMRYGGGKPSDGDLVDAMRAYGDDVDYLEIYVDMKTGALIYNFGARNYELVEAEKIWNKNAQKYEYANERKLGPKVYAHFMGQDAADEAFKHLNEGVATHA